MLSVALADAASAMDLVQRLAGDIGAASVSLDADHGEVHVETKPHPSETVPRALSIIEDWLEEAGVDSFVVRLDGEPFVLERRPAQIASGR